jgi:hypothetical protein
VTRCRSRTVANRDSITFVSGIKVGRAAGPFAPLG